MYPTDILVRAVLLLGEHFITSQKSWPRIRCRLLLRSGTVPGNGTFRDPNSLPRAKYGVDELKGECEDKDGRFYQRSHFVGDAVCYYSLWADEEAIEKFELLAPAAARLRCYLTDVPCLFGTSADWLSRAFENFLIRQSEGSTAGFGSATIKDLEGGDQSIEIPDLFAASALTVAAMIGMAEKRRTNSEPKERAAELIKTTPDPWTSVGRLLKVVRAIHGVTLSDPMAHLFAKLGAVGCDWYVEDPWAGWVSAAKYLRAMAAEAEVACIDLIPLARRHGVGTVTFGSTAAESALEMVLFLGQRLAGVILWPEGRMIGAEDLSLITKAASAFGTIEEVWWSQLEAQLGIEKAKLTVAAVNAREIEVRQKPGERVDRQSTALILAMAAPKQYLRGWLEILGALGLSNDKEQRGRVERLSKQRNGPIIFGARGTRPVVEKCLLIEWWNQLEVEIEDQKNQAVGRLAEAAECHDFGRDGKSAPAIGGSIKARRRQP